MAAAAVYHGNHNNPPRQELRLKSISKDITVDGDSPVAIDARTDTGRSRELAQRTSLPLCQSDGECATFTYLLTWLGDDGHATPMLALRDTSGGSGDPLWVDFIAGKMGHRRQFGGGRGQPLARAMGLKGGANPHIVDATAGLGRDGFVLASLGARVTLLERSPVMAALLADGLERARQHPETRTIVDNHLQLVNTDAIAWLRQCPAQERPEVVYLDPMYPHRSKSALVKKEMRALRAMVGDDTDAPALLAAALGCAKKRVVVKRPKGAAPLAGPKPGGEIASKNTRYDLYPGRGVTEC